MAMQLEEYARLIRDLEAEKSKNAALEEKKSQLEGELSEYTDDNMTKFQGRGKIKRDDMSPEDHQNMDVIMRYIRVNFGRYYKFVEPGEVKKWDPSNPKSISARVFPKCAVPMEQSDQFYYITKVVPFFNKGMVENRSRITAAVKKAWKGEYARGRNTMNAGTNGFFALPAYHDLESSNMNAIMSLMKGVRTDHSKIFNYEGVFFEFVWHIGSKIYSKSFLRNELKKKKGRSLIGTLTNSDYAMVATVMENNLEVWVDEKRIKGLPHEEQALHLKKNQVGMSDEEKEKYQKATTKWTTNEGKKRGFMEVGWSGEGIEYYRRVEEAFGKAKADKQKWKDLEEAWKEYASDHCDLTEYRPTKKARTSAPPPLEVTPEQQLHATFSMPGDDDYEEELGWQQEGEEEEEEGLFDTPV